MSTTTSLAIGANRIESGIEAISLACREYLRGVDNNILLLVHTNIVLCIRYFSFVVGKEAMSLACSEYLGGVDNIVYCK